MASWRAKGGGFEIRWYEGGRRRSEMFHGNRRQLLRRVNEIELLASGRPQRDGPATVADVMAAWALHGGKRTSPLSHEGVERRTRRWINPAIGHLPVEKVTHLTLEAFYRSLGAKLAPSTIRNIHSDLHGAFRLAVRDRLITTSPADSAHVPSSDTAEVEPPSVVDLTAFLAYVDAKGDPISVEVGLAARIAIATGARVGEVCGLRWGDIDTDACTISIVRGVVSLAGRRNVVRSTKTKVRRRAAIPESLALRLAAHRNAKALRWPDDLKDKDYIFSAAPGEPISTFALGSRFRRLRNEAGLSFRFHDLRHFAMSAWLAEMPTAAASRAMGHMNLSTTEGYAHLIDPDVERRTAEAIARRIDL